MRSLLKGRDWAMYQCLYTLCCVLESGRYGAESGKKVASGRKVAGDIRSAVNIKGLQLEYGRALYETLLVHVLMYGCETIVRREKEKFRVRAVKMNNIRGLLGERIECRIHVFRGVWSDKHFLQWFSHIEIMGKDRIAKRVYMGEWWILI